MNKLWTLTNYEQYSRVWCSKSLNKALKFHTNIRIFTVQSLRVINRHIIGESAVAGEIQGSQDWCRLLTKDDDNTKANVTSSSGLLLLRTPMSPSVNSSVCLLLLIWCDMMPLKDILQAKVSSNLSANTARFYQPIATKSIFSVGRLLTHFHVVNTIHYTIHTCQYTHAFCSKSLNKDLIYYILCM